MRDISTQACKQYVYALHEHCMQPNKDFDTNGNALRPSIHQ